MNKASSPHVDLLKRPMFWRMLIAIVILGYGQKVFGAQEESAPQANAEAKKSWSVVISPDNPESEQTLSTFTADDQTDSELKIETQTLLEENDPNVSIVPMTVGTFPEQEKTSDKEVVAAQGVIEKPCCENGKGKLNYGLNDYVQIYNSIPFSRSQYDANPSYRHDATMEIILGQPKPVTIIKQEVKREAVLAPYQQFLNPYLNPWYLTSGYPNLSSTPVYSLWRPYRPFYYGYGQSGLYQPGYYGP